MLSHPRSTPRYRCIPAPDEDALRRAIVTLARRFGRYGYRRVTALLRRAGWIEREKIFGSMRQRVLSCFGNF